MKLRYQIQNWIKKQNGEKGYINKSGNSSYLYLNGYKIRISDHKNQSIYHFKADINIVLDDFNSFNECVNFIKSEIKRFENKEYTKKEQEQINKNIEAADNIMQSFLKHF